MSKFRTEKPEPRGHLVTLRLSAEQNEILTQAAEQQNVSKGELLRIALDYWLEHSAEGKRALKRK
jgi:hypothetical protein